MDNKEESDGLPSKLYRMMIYFAHSTLVIYSKTIIDKKEMTIQEFRKQNNDVLQRVFDEGLSIFNYELSYDQISKSIAVYLKSKYEPSSVFERKIYQTKNGTIKMIQHN